MSEGSVCCSQPTLGHSSISRGQTGSSEEQNPDVTKALVSVWLARVKDVSAATPTQVQLLTPKVASSLDSQPGSHHLSESS